MTSLVAWVGVDSRGPASVYIASDSRITWGAGHRWDYGRKLYASASSPEILAYCGDVLFPSQALGRALDLIDSGVIFAPSDSPTAKWSAIIATLTASLEGYPEQQAGPFTIAYCTRDGSGMGSRFYLSSLQWEPAKGWTDRGWTNVPEHSEMILALGTGQRALEKWYSYWQNTREARTSRSVFSAFSDALASAEDPRSGGPPQLVGIYRKGPAESFGIVYRGDPYLLGTRAQAQWQLDAVEWRNTLFERCDPHTLELLPTAKRHSRPRGLAKD